MHSTTSNAIGFKTFIICMYFPIEKKRKQNQNARMSYKVKKRRNKKDIKMYSYPYTSLERFSGYVTENDKKDILITERAKNIECRISDNESIF